MSGRLSRLKKEKSSPLKKTISDEKSAVRPALPPSWIEVCPYVWKRTIVKENPLRDRYNNLLLLKKDLSSVDLIFYDTETTGLSSGAGTIPFLIGLGKIRNRSMEIIQYFLADYPGEKNMLVELKKDFSDDAAYVSYNGKSYDSHLLNTRFLMNGIKVSNRKEIDLLYISRRLWKSSLENCRLGTIEKEVLSVTRGPDIPGSEIPDVWFDFLKTGSLEKLNLVFSHNLHDIYSLALLLEKTQEIMDLNCRDDLYDKTALGKFLLLNGVIAGAELLYEEFSAGNREAGVFLSLFYKKQGDWQNAVSIWNELNARGINIFAACELAKYYEHREKDFNKALSLVNKLLKSPLKSGLKAREELEYRKSRLLKKMS